MKAATGRALLVAPSKIQFRTRGHELAEVDRKVSRRRGQLLLGEGQLTKQRPTLLRRFAGIGAVNDALESELAQTCPFLRLGPPPAVGSSAACLRKSLWISDAVVRL